MATHLSSSLPTAAAGGAGAPIPPALARKEPSVAVPPAVISTSMSLLTMIERAKSNFSSVPAPHHPESGALASCSAITSHILADRITATSSSDPHTAISRHLSLSHRLEIAGIDLSSATLKASGGYPRHVRSDSLASTTAVASPLATATVAAAIAMRPATGSYPSDPTPQLAGKIRKRAEFEGPTLDLPPALASVITTAGMVSTGIAGSGSLLHRVERTASNLVDLPIVSPRAATGAPPTRKRARSDAVGSEEEARTPSLPSVANAEEGHSAFSIVSKPRSAPTPTHLGAGFLPSETGARTLLNTLMALKKENEVAATLTSLTSKLSL